MSGDERDLVTSEGVDEGSAAMSTESEGHSTADPVGEPPQGEPRNDEQDAAPQPLGDEQPGPGQRLQVGEG